MPWEGRLDPLHPQPRWGHPFLPKPVRRTKRVPWALALGFLGRGAWGFLHFVCLVCSWALAIRRGHHGKGLHVTGLPASLQKNIRTTPDVD